MRADDRAALWLAALLAWSAWLVASRVAGWQLGVEAQHQLLGLRTVAVWASLVPLWVSDLALLQLLPHHRLSRLLVACLAGLQAALVGVVAGLLAGLAVHAWLTTC